MKFLESKITKNILGLFMILSLNSCKDGIKSYTSKNQTTPNYENTLAEDASNILISFEAEKIGLLSLKHEIPVEKSKQILKEYLQKKLEDDRLISNENPANVVALIDSLAIKYTIQSKNIASLIFDFQFNEEY